LDRIFLDANVLFSAAYREDSGLGRLWQLEDAELLTSAYMIEEARRSLALDRQPALARLEPLALKLTLIRPPRNLKLPGSIRLDSKDQPVLLAAIHGKADFLLTGDGRHFGHLYGRRIEGVLVLRPSEYFERRRRG
jgi:predicted nucleic acid-binding protein